MGDRGGGRESKGTSLKKSKKNPGSTVAKAKTVAKAPNSGPAFSLTPPAPGNELYFDAGVALLSRQFDRDRDRVISRAKQDGNCCGMLLWFSDVEKQSTVADLCKTHSGACYFSTGIHPDNIDRTNKKSHEDWLKNIEDLAKRSECVGILSGLNLTREVGTHFAQESLLKGACALADKLLLPVILHVNDAKSLERCIEILRGEDWIREEDTEEGAESAVQEHEHRKVLLHDALTCCEGDVENVIHARDAGFYFILAATGLTDADETVHAKAESCVREIPTERLIVGTDSPWKTPQNLPDVYLRTQRNEPSNVESIVLALSTIRGVENGEFASTIRQNTLRVFGLEFLSADKVANSGTAEEAEGAEDGVEKVLAEKVKNLKVTSENEADEHTGAIDRNNKQNKQDKFEKIDKKKEKKSKNNKHNDSEPEDDEEFHNKKGNKKNKAVEKYEKSIEKVEKVEKSDKKSNKKHDKVEKNSGNIEDMPDNNKANNTNSTNTNTNNSTNNNNSNSNSNNKAYYSCLKCRTKLFTPANIITHTLNSTTKTIFKIGEEGLCASNIFLKSTTTEGDTLDENSDYTPVAKGEISGTSVALKGNNVECSECGNKLGKYNEYEINCACGAMVTGPVAKIASNKVEYFDGIVLDVQELANRARLELEELQRQDLLKEEEAEAIRLAAGTQKIKKAKKMKSENKGNFSSFRNKSFIPNASRSSSNKKQGNSLELLQEMIGNASSDEEED